MLTSNKLLLLSILLLSNLQLVSPRKSSRLLHDFGSKLSNATSELREDINAFFVGTVETGLIPSILKGSIYLNEVYGLVNRTGLIVAGVALVGISGYYFLNENQILPRADDLANNIKNVPDFLSSVLRRYLNPVLSSKPSYTSKYDTLKENYDRDYRKRVKAIITRRPLLRIRQRGKNVLDRHRAPHRELVLIDQYFNHPHRNQRNNLRPKRTRSRLKIPFFATPFRLINRRVRRKHRHFGREGEEFWIIRLYNRFIEDLHRRIVRRLDLR